MNFAYASSDRLRSNVRRVYDEEMNLLNSHDELTQEQIQKFNRKYKCILIFLILVFILILHLLLVTICIGIHFLI